MPPAVRDLQSLIKTQTDALAPQQELIDKSIASNDASGGAQEAGLAAKKDQAFTDITQGAQNKGMFFSGFSPDEQAKYTAGTYLPALAQLQSTIAQTRASLLGKKADLNKGAFDVATQQYENDRKVLADWNAMTAQQQFTASEAEKSRAFEAQQNLTKMQSAERIAAADRNAKAAAAKAAGAPAGLIGTISNLLNSKKGRDTFVSPETYRAGLQQWTSAGGSPDSYNATFSGYINPDHQAKFGGYL
jgi:hypothetical protein